MTFLGLENYFSTKLLEMPFFILPQKVTLKYKAIQNTVTMTSRQKTPKKLLKFDEIQSTWTSTVRISFYRDARKVQKEVNIWQPARLHTNAVFHAASCSYENTKITSKR